MVVTILQKPSKTFAGVSYNTNKVDRNKGELMLIANFGAIQSLNSPRPQDLVNYLLMVSAQNKAVKNTQLHAVLSANGRNYNKQELTQAAVLWLNEMGYGQQPYLIVFHNDTANNHVHVVTTRIDRNGAKINSAFEHVRSLRSINNVLGYTFALGYSFSTKAQFYLLLENQGFLGKDYIYDDKLEKKIAGYIPDKQRIAELKELFLNGKADPDFISNMKSRHRVDLVFHSVENRKPYGYTVIDHATRQIFKGSEILSLKLLTGQEPFTNMDRATPAKPGSENKLVEVWAGSENEHTVNPVTIRPVWIAGDIDDEAIHGRNRRRKKKARSNTR